MTQQIKKIIEEAEQKRIKNNRKLRSFFSNNVIAEEIYLNGKVSYIRP